MALIENFDVDFEDYIIFHRGISEVKVMGDNHMHVIYQDGYDQDLGDPYGDDVRKYFRDAEAAKNAALAAQQGAEQAKNDANGCVTQITTKLSEIGDFWDKIAEAQEKYEGMKQALSDAKTAADEAVGQVQAQAKRAEDAADAAENTSNSIVYEAEAWAQGTRGGVPVPDEDPIKTQNAKYYANTVEIRAEVWATGQMNGVDVPDSDDHSAPDINNNAKYYKVKADENRARAAYYAVGGIQSYTGIHHTPTTPELHVISQDKISWTNSAGNQTNVEMSAKKFAELAKQEATYSAESATNANNILAEVNNVAQEYVKPLDQLDGITKDEETGNYSIDPIPNEYIDMYFALLNPSLVSGTEYYMLTKNIADFSGEYEIYYNDVIPKYQEAYDEMAGQASSGSLTPEEQRALEEEIENLQEWFSSHAPIRIVDQPQDQAVALYESARFFVTAENVLSYTWQESMDGTSWYSNDFQGNECVKKATEENYGLMLKCVLTGYGGQTLETDIATLLEPEEQEAETNE